MICPLSPAHFAGLGAFLLSLLLLVVDPSAAHWPLAAFLAAALVAPLFTRVGFYLPVTSRGRKGETGVALTFDDGPDPAVTPRLLDLLDRHGVRAAFFVTGRNAEAHPGIVREAVARGHAVLNHTLNHDPLLAFRGADTVRREIAGGQEVLARLGIVPLAFRPPVGIVTPSFRRPLLEQGLACVNFSCRPVDFGNRRTGGIAARVLRKVAPGDIVLLHDVTPRDGDVERLLAQFEEILAGLAGRNLAAVPLPRLLGREVMRSTSDFPGGCNAATLFYDGLAERYDREQFGTSVSISKKVERELFEAALPKLLRGGERVLEIGVGTGIFTLDLAARAGEVVAADISGAMLAVLSRKAAERGIGNVRTVAGNVETMEFPGRFDLVCAFASLEYMADLPALFRRVAPHVVPGGTLHFTVARRSFLRFFTQLGNAVRQGIWLSAYGRREIEAMLRAAGFGEISVTPRLLAAGRFGGMLFEVTARRGGDGEGRAGRA
jgi:peptidoglycan/xylan/chitin deacetylase (PgdA/CDA1 family)/SAM-dependent methyltransferase